MRCHAFCLAVMRCPSEVSRVLLHTFLMRFGAFWPFGDVLVSLYAFLLHNFGTRYPDEVSCFWGPLRTLRMRSHAFLAAELSY